MAWSRKPAASAKRRTVERDSVVRVAEYLRDRQESARFEGAMALEQGGGTIGDFAESRAEEHQVETRSGDMRRGCIAEDRLQVPDTGSVRSCLEPLDHARHRFSSYLALSF